VSATAPTKVAADRKIDGLARRQGGSVPLIEANSTLPHQGATANE